MAVRNISKGSLLSADKVCNLVSANKKYPTPLLLANLWRLGDSAPSVSVPMSKSVGYLWNLSWGAYRSLGKRVVVGLQPPQLGRTPFHSDNFSEIKIVNSGDFQLLSRSFSSFRQLTAPPQV